MDSIWYCEQTNMFSLLCPHKFKTFEKVHEFNNYKNKEYIYFEEDAAHKIYLIAKGKVKVGYYDDDGNEIIKAILSKGELFGEKAILGENKRTEFAQSVDGNTAVCPIGVETMHDLMRTNKAFSLKIYKFLGMRFKKMERRLQLLLFKDTKTRLLEFLEELKEDYGYCCPNTGLIMVKHPYTQKDIASLIATSRPTLNILLNELQESNQLSFKRNHIVFQ
ncbi:Crp/Fnr family transcriptional regulator [Aquimarina agarilytica]|uniref:Crp/Fnr family transcriptional regulator n=1 Tax=Aquimarina agarilytica TaxID=1087449 RepID=UPI0002F57E6C|nr:Crp/Fnr family transcriptional regulator [Aquimarina agarilytica]